MVCAVVVSVRTVIVSALRVVAVIVIMSLVSMMRVGSVVVIRMVAHDVLVPRSWNVVINGNAQWLVTGRQPPSTQR